MMDNAARARDGFVVKAVVELGRGAPESCPGAEFDRRDDNVHIVDNVGVEERSDDGGSATESDVEPVRRRGGTFDGFTRRGIEKVKGSVGERERRPVVVGEHKHGCMERWIFAPTSRATRGPATLRVEVRTCCVP